jgi:hypothetical protein
MGTRDVEVVRCVDGLLDLSMVERPRSGADSASLSIGSVAAFARCVVTSSEPRRLGSGTNVT